jgi:hypothetical protein
MTVFFWLEREKVQVCRYNGSVKQLCFVELWVVDEGGVKEGWKACWGVGVWAC